MIRESKLGFKLRERHSAVSSFALSTAFPVFVVLVSLLVLSCGKSKPTEPEQPKVVMEFSHQLDEPNEYWQWYSTGPWGQGYWTQDYVLSNNSDKYIHDIICWFKFNPEHVREDGDLYIAFWRSDGPSLLKPQEEVERELHISGGEYPGLSPDLIDYGVWWEEY